jgi:hypothetical protein
MDASGPQFASVKESEIDDAPWFEVQAHDR